MIAKVFSERIVLYFGGSHLANLGRHISNIQKSKMAITLNTGFLKTIPGIFKIVEFILVLVVLLIARLGIDNKHVNWGGLDNTFLGIGICVGFAIIIPAILLTYLLGSIPSTLEYIINLVGGILFITMGALIVNNYSPTKVVGALAITLGIIFLLDLIYLCVTTRFTVFHTSGSGAVMHSTRVVQQTTATRTVRA